LRTSIQQVGPFHSRIIIQGMREAYKLLLNTRYERIICQVKGVRKTGANDVLRDMHCSIVETEQ